MVYVYLYNTNNSRFISYILAKRIWLNHRPTEYNFSILWIFAKKNKMIEMKQIYWCSEMLCSECEIGFRRIIDTTDNPSKTAIT